MISRPKVTPPASLQARKLFEESGGSLPGGRVACPVIHEGRCRSFHYVGTQQQGPSGRCLALKGPSCGVGSASDGGS